MLPDISKFLPGEKIYEDLLQPSAQQLGDAFKNVVKTARFLLAPVDYLATQQDRFQNYLKRIADKVPQENLVVASPQVVGKSFESLRYLEDDSILAEMFVNLLASSVDKTKHKNSHPAFPNIIDNISRDEAIILYFLNQQNFKIKQYAVYNRADNTFAAPQNLNNSFPVSKLDFPDNFFVYMNHLNSLNLAGVWQEGNQIPDIKNGIQVGVTINNTIMLQDFGKMFAAASMVDDISRFGVEV
ncbi:hypothetical protein HMPREF0326_01791 [Desulfovibrio sp. 3_1_syn3]|uniref:DUF4393 domain-containing protein n=1 Tax=Desulfovibrio sp. 3_1_syn3 TaxID=457398 RepID=UPI00039020E6|nr:DUF4393 domain-containing protein [Desulfovibrio sp. 3_1_syn3]EFL86088.2 hypothetical protein HMPREF0326_01791 [Desulfovibrio sp. 3_1_syn3]